MDLLLPTFVIMLCFLPCFVGWKLSGFSLLIVLSLFLAGSTIVQAQPQWQFQNTGVSFILTDINFPANQDSIGYAVGMSSTYNGNGVILKTTDAGNSWVQLNSSVIPGLEAVSFVSVDTGYIGGWQNYFAKTTNGGLSWTTSSVNTSIWYIKEIEFFNSQKGIVTAAGSMAYVTNNGGATWTAASGFINAEDINFVTADTVYAVGGDEKIARSVNGGLNWTTIYTGVFQNIFLGVDFYDARNGIVSGEDGKVLRTTNGGQTWNISNAGGFHLLRVAHMFDSLNALVAGTPEGVFVTSDGGQNWVSDFQGGNTYALYKSAFTPNGNAFLCGSQGRILKKVAVLTADFSVSNDSICSGDSVIYTHNSQGNPNGFAWTFAGGTPATYNGATPTAVRYSQPGLYDVQLIVSNANGADTLFRTAYIQVFAAAQANIGGSSQAIVGDTSTYNTANQAGHSYQWSVSGGQLISGQGSREIRVRWIQPLAGQIVLTLTNSLGCSSTDSLDVTIAQQTGLAQMQQATWQLFPNPVQTNLHLHQNGQQPANDMHFQIYDLLGRTHASGLLVNGTIDLHLLASGQYVLELKSAQAYSRHRFIKQ